MKYSHGNTAQKPPIDIGIDLRPQRVHARENCLKEPAENCYGHGAVLIWDQTENPFPQEFNQGQVSD